MFFIGYEKIVAIFLCFRDIYLYICNKTICHDNKRRSNKAFN